MKSEKNKILTEQELMEMATAAKGKINKIYLHWTAGPYGHVYDDYHFCVSGGDVVRQMANQELGIRSWGRVRVRR